MYRGNFSKILGIFASCNVNLHNIFRKDSYLNNN